MKLICSLLISFVLFSCSKDEENKIPSDTDTFKNSKIVSYSKNFGHSAEEITIYGENFTSEKSKITLTFDNVSATIISASLTEIKFILPIATTTIPELNLVIPNRSITKEVVNAYNGNIGILPAINYNNWAVINVNPNTFLFDDMSAIQHIDNNKIYVAMGGQQRASGVFRTLDGGISWKKWANNWYSIRANEGFHANNNDAGLSSYSGAIIIPVGGTEYLNRLPIPIQFVGASYIDDDMKYTTVAQQNGKIYSSSNGIDFSLAYESSFWATGNSSITCSHKQDFNNMWIGAVKQLTQNGNNNYPVLIYKTNTSSGWQEYSFPQDNTMWQNFRQIQMLSALNGFALIHKYAVNSSTQIGARIYKTNNGGSSWTLVYDNNFLKNISFKDQNIGWAVNENKIFKTINGGVSWQLDYTHNQDLKNISYKDGVVWSFSKDNILKYYIQ